MKTGLVLVSLALILYALWTYPKHPGRYGAVMLCSFGFTAVLGSVGAPLSLIGIGAAVLKLAAKPQRISFPELAFSAWVVFLTASLFWSRDITVGFTGLAEVVFLAGGAYLYGKTHINNENFLDDVLDFTALISVVTVVALLFVVRGDGPRLGSASGLSPVGIAGIPEIGLICCFSMLLFQPMSWRRRAFLFILLFGLFLPFSLATGTRSVLLSFGMVILVFMFQLLCTGRHKAVLGMIAFFVLLGVGAYFIIPLYLGPSGGELMGNIVRRVLSLSGGKDPASLQRLGLYHQAVGMFENSPLIGYGLSAFGYMADGLGGADAYPHNMFLEILIDSGLIGLVLFGVFLLSATARGYRWLGRKDMSWQMAVLIGLMTSALVRHQVSLSILAGKELLFALGGLAGLAYQPASTTAKDQELS
jgi:O-antigen ligase